MFTLFSQEEITQYHEQQIREEAEARGKAEGFAEGAKALMVRMSLTAEEAMNALGVPAEMRNEVAKRL